MSEPRVPPSSLSTDASPPDHKFEYFFHIIFVIEYLHICIWIYICWWCCDAINFKISISETDLWHASTGGGAGKTRRRKVKSVSPAHFLSLLEWVYFQHSVNIWLSLSVLNILPEMLWFSFLGLRKCLEWPKNDPKHTMIILFHLNGVVWWMWFVMGNSN